MKEMGLNKEQKDLNLVVLIKQLSLILYTQIRSPTTLMIVCTSGVPFGKPALRLLECFVNNLNGKLAFGSQANCFISKMKSSQQCQKRAMYRLDVGTRQRYARGIDIRSKPDRLHLQSPREQHDFSRTCWTKDAPTLPVHQHGPIIIIEKLKTNHLTTRMMCSNGAEFKRRNAT